MTQLLGFDDPINVDSWNLDTQNAQNTQNAGNPTGCHHAFGHYPLRPAIPMPASQLSWSPHGEPYKANPGAQIPPLLQAPFPVPPTTPSSFSPVPLPFYQTTPVTAPTAAPTAVPTGAFAEAPIATPATAAPAIASSIPTALTAAPVAPVVPARRPAATSISNNGRGSTKGRGKRGGTTRGSIRGRGSHGGTSTPYVVGASSPASPPSPSPDWPTPALPSDAESNSEEERPKKKTRNRNMKPHEKLVLIQECCEHEDEYKPNNKGKFWSMIGELLKQKTGYELVHPMQTVT